jgi:hypothetical protein
MIFIISTFIPVVIVFTLIARLATRITFGKILKDEVWVPILEKQIQKGSKCNPFDPSIIDIGDLPFISNVPFDILGYYYISGHGVISRWSKSHKLIKAEFKKQKQKELDRYNKELEKYK